MMCSPGSDGPLRVAAYCRVSTDKEDQRNSLSAQQAFFQRYIQAHPNWVLVDVFADEGLSGTSTRHRPQFTEMIRQAMSGAIDLILTKEVSRFARNTVDTLQITRRLKERHVGVCFLNDNIDTRDNDGEFRLAIMASVAQEESRKISERTRWGQLQAMRRGVVFGNNSIYGYTLRGGRLTVVPEQAAIVRQIYRSFLAGRKGAYTIARELTQAGVSPPLRPEGAWSSTMVLRILRNEKYCGDLLQKKYRTTDYLTHRKILNDGAEESFYFPDHHEAIVSREDFQAAQAELSRRAHMPKEGTRYSARYWYSGKVRCGQCGRSFAVKRTHRANGTEYARFVCRGRLGGNQTCQMRAVYGPVILTVARHVLRQLSLDSSAILARLIRECSAVSAADAGLERSETRLQQAFQRQWNRKNRALESFLDGELAQEEMRCFVARCEEEMVRIQTELRHLAARKQELSRKHAHVQDLRAWLERELDGGEAVLDELIQRITVCQDCFLVEVAELPVRFRVRAGKGGPGAGDSIAVTECIAEPSPQPMQGDPRSSKR